MVFDSVRHHNLASKLANVTMTDYIYKRIDNSLSGSILPSAQCRFLNTTD